ncbi:hypothetical protein [Stenotrophomonas sp. 364]|uniref:hypothetical protein n=1 Tax=Stenotrophomonas sp. 364 TaxID=2691571 RepID=UPI001319280A|nr:hypothetical protein [Stenotrophomonas sp. 364]QHB71455.1 hypothetical protein GQ674_09155 [Stenotrophomonas sp. 364]
MALHAQPVIPLDGANGVKRERVATIDLGHVEAGCAVGLTASSIAIMGSAPEEKAGSAEALEATRYDLGTGLGITGFGLVLASSYRNAIELPGGLPAGMAAKATESIGETLVAAQALEGAGGCQSHCRCLASLQHDRPGGAWFRQKLKRLRSVRAR